MPEEVLRRYRELRVADPTRPVFLNFGQAVANPRGSAAAPSAADPAAGLLHGQPAAAPTSSRSTSIPLAEERQTTSWAGSSWSAQGVANLQAMVAKPGQPVWSAIETTHINHPLAAPTPQEVRSEVWMALIHGANGIFYFVHEWQPSFREDGVFRYPEVVARDRPHQRADHGAGAGAQRPDARQIA